jgi:hypothetical protein
MWKVPSISGYGEMYTLYTDAVGVLLHINRMFTMGKLKSSLFSIVNFRSLPVFIA